MFADLDKVNEVLGQNVLVIVFVVAVVWFIVTKLAETKDSFAKILGPIGRRILHAKEKREERHREEVRLEAKRVLKEAGTLEPPDYQTVKRRLSNVLEEVSAQAVTIREVQLENRGLRTYIMQDEDWHWEDERSAIRENRTVRHRVSFDEFMDDFMHRNLQRERGLGNGTPI
ncbi:gp42 [Mycobacterium phage Konstantine]|uniref:Uncharacterized protein n=1 Tax=Mycobacterium phage Konstantine TaxID=563121 RepID=B5U512_9CAUD|nr:gp42 [Mycobacterium phage Konstantine]ACI12458.1 hypothetical protein KONSTANTINE_42 [Mycobacterium phage Konstantine]